MDFATAILGTHLRNISAADLRAYFDSNPDETENVELKSGSTGISEVVAQVVGFLNGAGGLIVWGSPNPTTEIDETGARRQNYSGPIVSVQRRTKDDLNRALMGNIQPLPLGIRIQECRVDGGAIFVIEVDPSSSPPHQEGGKYWIRVDGETRAASHGVVESLFLRRRGPAFVMTARQKVTPIPSAHGRIDLFRVKLDILLRNESKNIGEFVEVGVKCGPGVVERDSRLDIVDPKFGDEMEGPISSNDGFTRWRFRVNGWVVHAHSWRVLQGNLVIAREAGGGLSVALGIAIQAKDMARAEWVADFGLDDREGEVQFDVR